MDYLREQIDVGPRRHLSEEIHPPRLASPIPSEPAEVRCDILHDLRPIAENAVGLGTGIQNTYQKPPTATTNIGNTSKSRKIVRINNRGMTLLRTCCHKLVKYLACPHVLIKIFEERLLEQLLEGKLS